MRLLYIVTKGIDDPTLASVPLHIAASFSAKLYEETHLDVLNAELAGVARETMRLFVVALRYVSEGRRSPKVTQ